MTTPGKMLGKLCGSVTSHELAYRLEVFPVWRVSPANRHADAMHRQCIMLPDLGKMPVKGAACHQVVFGVDLDKSDVCRLLDQLAGMLRLEPIPQASGKLAAGLEIPPRSIIL